MSAIVPYEFLATQPAQAQFVVEYQDAFSAPFAVPVTTEAPGLFSYNSTGTGWASLFGAGDGEEDPIPVTGSVNPPTLTNSLHSVHTIQ